MPRKYSDLDPTWRVNIEVNRYRQAVAQAHDLVEHLEDMVAEQEQRERDARRKARRK